VSPEGIAIVDRFGPGLTVGAAAAGGA
jgi:hypothetical protein